MVPIVAEEIPNAALCMPLAFILKENKYSLAVVLSVIPGKNMFVAPDGRWLGGYVPSAFRSHPFGLMEFPGHDKKILCVDETSGLVVPIDGGGELFFENGELSKTVKDVMNFLHRIEQNRTITEKAVATLAEAGVIAAWRFQVDLHQEKKSLAGFYKIDESKLNNLSDQDFVKLRRSGALQIAYAQLFSMKNSRIFPHLAKLTESFLQNDSDVPMRDFGDEEFIRF